LCNDEFIGRDLPKLLLAERRSQARSRDIVSKKGLHNRQASFLDGARAEREPFTNLKTFPEACDTLRDKSSAGICFNPR